LYFLSCGDAMISDVFRELSMKELKHCPEGYIIRHGMQCFTV